MDILGQNMSKEIISAVKKLSSSINNKNFGGPGGLTLGNKNSSLTENELRDMIMAKADKQDLIELN